ncbi:FAD-binding domain-containing protein [Spongiivirga citrea]|uniref:Deoxyribodipyrimidine photolyase n=1 Tax=Spongiivirga citrea TaxID=1481457 RepID=A0A6M0CP21_9FLAO|nr:FAD-binding domain-containing protein [Spongiivirga citrea]NER17227.1 deoxyribodipyrimidine photolyase [Spongiivirga citrea]
MNSVREIQYEFPISIEAILNRIDLIDPIKYGKTRNFINGAVTYLSPYISRGVISTKQVLANVLEKGYKTYDIEKFIQELAWRDYWQQVWIAKGNKINTDLKRPQEDVTNHELAHAVIEGQTGITAIDIAIKELYESGYMHNHIRMYTAAIACNMAKSHWLTPARWMYYHLIDGDWASNALSWQWVAGASANKKYVANQENINKYCFTNDQETFLDVPYDAFGNFDTPTVLQETINPALQTNLPKSDEITLQNDVPTCFYNYYNLDPNWLSSTQTNNILLIEPSHFEHYPISDNSMNFMLDLSKNISNIQVYVGEFETFINEHQPTNTHYKEHPLNKHYKGTEHDRDWMFDVTGYYPSFFGFWKQCKKELKKA